jgi:hypothetical protein
VKSWLFGRWYVFYQVFVKNLFLDYLSNDLYSDGMIGLKCNVYILEKLHHERSPKLSDFLLKKNDCSYHYFTTSWFLTMFYGSLPLEVN